MQACYPFPDRAKLLHRSGTAEALGTIVFALASRIMRRGVRDPDNCQGAAASAEVCGGASAAAAEGFIELLAGEDGLKCVPLLGGTA